MKHLVFIVCLLGLIACEVQNMPTNSTMVKDTMRNLSTKELIILAPPPDGDQYYASVSNDIFQFHIAYAKQILKHDDVLVFAGKKILCKIRTRIRARTCVFGRNARHMDARFQPVQPNCSHFISLYIRRARRGS